jgi:hypothetical protein
VIAPRFQYVARCACGCCGIVAFHLFEPTEREAAAAFVGDAIRGGHVVDRVFTPLTVAGGCLKSALIVWPDIGTVRDLLGALRRGFELRQLPLSEGSAASASPPFRIFKDGVTPARQVLDAGTALAAIRRGLIETDRQLEDGAVVYRLPARPSRRRRRCRSDQRRRSCLAMAGAHAAGHRSTRCDASWLRAQAALGNWFAGLSTFLRHLP